MMQKFLMKINTETLSIVIDILSKSLDKIIVDIYGNYFCQKLISHCNTAQKIQILNSVIKLLIYLFIK